MNYSKNTVHTVVDDLTQFNLKLFSSSIENDVLNGNISEIVRKCKAYAGNVKIQSIIVKDSENNIICKHGPKITESQNYFYENIYFDEENKSVAARVIVSATDLISSRLIFNFIILVSFTTFFLILTYWLVARKYLRSSFKLLEELATKLKTGNISTLKSISKENTSNKILEIDVLFKGIEDQAQKVQLLQDHLIRSERTKVAEELAKHLAHDIKSPLSAINLVLSTANLDETDKSLLLKATKRIEDLVVKISNLDQIETIFQEKSENCDLLALSTKIFSEFKAVYAQSKQIHFSINVSGNVFTSFLNPLNFERVLSNILKNSIEAVKENGNIALILTELDSKFQISIQDDGHGIPKEILTNIGNRGNTYGKKGGSGLGLFQAKAFMKSLEGDLIAQSTPGNTLITLVFPKLAKQNENSEILYSENDNFIILDNEILIHEVWKKILFPKIDPSKVFFFISPSEFLAWQTNNQAIINKSILLFDYNLEDDSTNGLQLIQKISCKAKYIISGEEKTKILPSTSASADFNFISKSQLGSIKLITR